MDIRIAPELQRQLEMLARERGMSVDQLLRDLLQSVGLLGEATDPLQSDRSCYDLARASGVIGSVQDAPPDLSTSPDHLDGFGHG